MKVTFDELQAFVTIATAGSISRASEHLDLTVSATSRLLGRLEEKLGITLLVRTTRRMSLTAEGLTFLYRAQSILDHVEAAEEEISARQLQPSGLLRVDSATPLMLHVVVPLLAEYRRRYPAVELELLSNEGVIDLIEHRADVALRIGKLKDSTLRSRPIGMSALRLLASPDYLALHGRPKKVSDLFKHTLLGFTQPDSLNIWPLADGHEGMLTITPTLRAANGETLRHLALQSMGIVCLSDFMTVEDRKQGRLVPVLAPHTLPMHQSIHAVYYRHTTVSSRVWSFVDYLASSLNSSSWSA